MECKKTLWFDVCPPSEDDKRMFLKKGYDFCHVEKTVGFANDYAYRRKKSKDIAFEMSSMMQDHDIKVMVGKEWMQLFLASISFNTWTVGLHIIFELVDDFMVIEPKRKWKNLILTFMPGERVEEGDLRYG